MSATDNQTRLSLYMQWRNEAEALEQWAINQGNERAARKYRKKAERWAKMIEALRPQKPKPRNLNGTRVVAVRSVMDKDVERIFELRAKNLTFQSIADKLGLTKSQCIGKYRRERERRERGDRLGYEWTPEQVEALRSEYGDCECLGDLAKKIGRSLPSLNSKAARLGLTRSPRIPTTESQSKPETETRMASDGQSDTGAGS